MKLFWAILLGFCLALVVVAATFADWYAAGLAGVASLVMVFVIGIWG